MSEFSETAVEDTPLEWLTSLGYDVPHGPQIVADILPAQVTGHNPIPNKAPPLALPLATGGCHAM